MSELLQNQSIVEGSKIDNSYTHIHDLSLSLLSEGTSVYIFCVKLELWTQTAPRSEMIRSCKCSPHMSNMPTLTHNRTSGGILVLTRKYKQ